MASRLSPTASSQPEDAVLQARVAELEAELETAKASLAVLAGAETALRDSETRYRALFDTMGDAVAIYRAVDGGADFAIVDFNAAAENAEHVSRQEIIGKRVLKVFPGIRDFGLLAVFQRVWATGRPEHHPVSFYQDGRIAGWRENQVYRLPSGEIVAVYHDRTAAKRAEAALLEERNRLRTLIDHLPDLVYFKDREGRFVVANQAVARAAGVPSPEALLGRTAADFCPPELAGRSRDDEQEVLASGRALLDREEEWTDDQGRIHWMQTSLLPLTDDQGRPVGLVGVGRDVTEHRRLDQELIQIQRQRAVNELSAGISHNLNNILTAVLMPAQMLERRITESGAQELVGTILEATQRARDLVQRWHQCLGNEPDTAAHPVRLDQAVVDAVQATLPRWKDESEARGIRIAVEYEPRHPLLVQATASGLRDVLTVLLLNAVEAMPAGGAIRIRTFAEEGWVRLEVTDTGIGMDEQTRLQLFEPFFTTKMDVGSGLGLPTLHRLVTGWEGRVEVRSAPGRGTTFVLRLHPGQEPASAVPRAVAPVASRSGRILIVDDDQVVATALASLLAERHAVEAVTDPRVACDQCRPGRYDIAVIDLGMPGISGVEVAERLRRADPALALVLWTGWELAPEDPRRRPFDYCLTKPVGDLAELETLISRAIALRDRRARPDP